MEIALKNTEERKTPCEEVRVTVVGMNLTPQRQRNVTL